jgi:hypothetical protein
MIPKTLHYIWIGKNPEPIIGISSWKKILSSYEIRRWSEKDLDFNKYKFAKKAYDLGKYGIAIDPFKAEILVKYGGIWIDIDTIIYKDLEPFLQYSFFIGYENMYRFAVGLFGVTPNHPLLQRILKWYEKYWSTCAPDISPEHFEYIHRSNFTSPLVFTRLFTREYGIIPDSLSKTVITKDGAIRLEAPPVFTIRGDFGIENYAEHLYISTWLKNKTSDYYKEVVSWYKAHR